MSAQQAEHLQRLHMMKFKIYLRFFPTSYEETGSICREVIVDADNVSEYEAVFYMDASIHLRHRYPLIDILISTSSQIKVNIDGIYDGAFTREEAYKQVSRGNSYKQVSKCCQTEGGLCKFTCTETAAFYMITACPS